jgi:hypothetical protein
LRAENLNSSQVITHTFLHPESLAALLKRSSARRVQSVE